MMFHSESAGNQFRCGSSDDDPNGICIGIVGCGPRGLFCLDSLTRQLTIAPLRNRPTIHIFEASGHFGSGHVYAPGQPDCLRMNFATRFIDVWERREPLLSPHCLNLENWLRRVHPCLAKPGSFVPRSVVGGYLSDSFQLVVSNLRSVANVHLHACEVNSISKKERRWSVSFGEGVLECSQLVVTTGHGSTFSDDNDDGEIVWKKVYPVTRCLAEENVGKGTSVALRGFGLTTIDAILHLTEGRGGSLKERDGRLNYIPSGLEPEKIVPFSRTGRPMLAKPNLEEMSLPASLDQIWNKHRARIENAKSGSFSDSILPQLFEAANEALKVLGGSGDIEVFFEQWCDSDLTADQTLKAMADSVEIARGRRQPNQAWALGESWRQLYSSMVERLNYGGLAVEERPHFQRVASEMERIAFGPPAVNLTWIIALTEAGILDLQCLKSPEIERKSPNILLRRAGAEMLAEHSFNTVLIAPTAGRSPLRNLMKDNHLEITDEGAVVIDSSGRTSGGLYVFGRPTEGWVIGNDTLSRVLHTQPEKWAKALHSEILSDRFILSGTH